MPETASPLSLETLRQQSHIWFFKPESVDDPAEVESFVSVLSKDEREKYRRFHFPEDRHRYLVSHAMVRHLLSRYVNLRPNEWRFVRSRHGRPEIANPGLSSLRFNLTHTDGLVACIVTHSVRCGIDAERICNRQNLLSVRNRMFSPSEYTQTAGLPTAAQLRYFFKHWTLREAYVKACGPGLWLSAGELSFLVTETGSILVDFGPALPDGNQGWLFQLIYPTDNHIAAAAIQCNADNNAEIQSEWFCF